MEYKVSELASLAGVSARTIRFYDSCGLLRPLYVNESGYRIYGAEQVKRLQRILLYRELGVEVKAIPELLNGETDAKSALTAHLVSLRDRRAQLDALIKNVEKSIEAEKGNFDMKDSERFEGFMKKLVDENEARYGSETREKYGDAAMDASNKKLLNMNEKEYSRMSALEEEVKAQLVVAMKAGDVRGAEAKKLFELHRDWLCCTIPNYSAEMHKGLALMYTADERFKKYYDDVAAGGAEFIAAAINENCK